MNIQKIFEVLEENEMDSALALVVGELENQGYAVRVLGIPVTSDEIYEGKYDDIYKLMEPITIALYKKEVLEQEFDIIFTDYHKITIQKKTE